MKVYVITSGEYSDYGIEAVCLDKDKAEQICATINDGLIRAKLYGDTASIEEYDTDEYEIDSDLAIGNLYVLHAKYNKISEQYMYEPMLTFMRKDITFEKIGDEVHVEATFPIEMNREKAEKIMRDELAKWKAGQEDLL